MTVCNAKYWCIYVYTRHMCIYIYIYTHIHISSPTILSERRALGVLTNDTLPEG